MYHFLSPGCWLWGIFIFSLFVIEETIKNFHILSKKFISDKNVCTTNELNSFYLEFLKQHRPNQTILKNSTLTFIVDDPNIGEALQVRGHFNLSEDLMNKTVTAIKDTLEMPNVNNLLTARTIEMLTRSLRYLESNNSPPLINVGMA